MPIILVGDEVFEKRLECIVNPIKGNELYLYLGVEGKIMEKAGKEELIELFDKANPFESVCPFITSGLKLSDKIIHIIATEMSESLDFKHDMYFAYDRVVRMAMDEKVKKLVFPSIPYSYKRKGRLNTYRTSISMLRYLTRWYNPDFTVFLLVDKEGVRDHGNNYESDYVPSSFPVSKRHKPLDYPLTSFLEVKKYFLKNVLETAKYENYILERMYDIEVLEKYKKLYDALSLNFRDHASFCNESNMAKDRFVSIFNGKERPTKEELLAMCLAVQFDIKDTLVILRNEGYNLSLSNPFDKIIIDFINKEQYDVYSINEYLYVNDYPQLGSITSYELICESN